MDNFFVYNTMIRAYSNSVTPINAIHIYNQMHEKDVPHDNFSHTFVLKACAKHLWVMEEEGSRFKAAISDVSRKGFEIHCRILVSGYDQEQFVMNSLISLYSQCGFLGFGRRVFDEMSERSVCLWNTMIAAYDQVRDYGSADLLFESMPVKDVVSWNMLISRFVKLGDVEAARRVFEGMPERDAVSWNSMIAGHVQVKNYGGALELFREMQVADVEPTEITLISVLGACAETGALEMGRKIHDSLKKKSCKIEGFLGNALVDMYAKCGSLYQAWEVFNRLKIKHVSCWNAMIVGLAVHGYSEEALRLFDVMETKLDEVRPNRVTFVGVFIACSHKGLVKEGRSYFKRMVEDHEITADMKHYGCMVDMFSRWGWLQESFDVIKTMPFDANAILWRTLLGACRTHGNVDMAEECFEQLSKLGSLNDADYVLLSNIYADAERWNDVERVRNVMISYGIGKEPGFSNIQMK
ncbi:Pentatricopeptide repeat [Dillenia turbinata]|uniref:Pentatricopeptide repeat n=1 Tax=Dillenia turbinata TaxID=194707 RepID=A0AAN8W0Y0_9MAGN